MENHQNNNGIIITTTTSDDTILGNNMEEEPMMVDLEDGGDEIKKNFTPTKITTDSTKEAHLINKMQEDLENVVTVDEDQRFERLEDDNSDDDVIMIRKQTSSNVASFIQPSSVHARHCAKENPEKSNSEEGVLDQSRGSSGSGDNGGQPRLDGWIEDIMESISEPLFLKKESLAIADICKERNRPRLVINKSQIREQYGYEIGGTTYLWAEEALYLLENGKLEIYVDEIAISVERARSLLLHSKYINTDMLENAEEILTCEVDEYTVYKYFARMGYRIRRRESQRYGKPKVDATNVQPNNMQVDEDVQSSTSTDDSAVPNSNQAAAAGLKGQNFNPIFGNPPKRGLKRKATIGLISDDEDSSGDSDSVKTLSDDSDLDENDECLFVGNVAMSEAEEDTSSEVFSYTVVEADSDVEIVDEVIISHGSVGIEEIEAEIRDDYEELHLADIACASSSVGQEQPGPSSAARVIVDLVSSDSESDLEEITNENIWADFSSVTKFAMKFLPQHLLPESISTRSDDKVYTFCIIKQVTTISNKNVMDQQEPPTNDIEIEKSVDELKLDSSSKINVQNAVPIPKSEPEKVTCDSWKQWRHLVMTEARDILNESLLGAAGPAGTIRTSVDVAKKLNLWKDDEVALNTNEDFVPVSGLHMPFDLFPISNRSVTKHKLWNTIQPLYHVAVVRTSDPVLSSYDVVAQLRSDTNDNIPLIIAVVNDEAEVNVIASDLKPLPSLF